MNDITIHRIWNSPDACLAGSNWRICRYVQETGRFLVLFKREYVGAHDTFREALKYVASQTLKEDRHIK